MIKVARTCYLGNYLPNAVGTQGFWQYRTVSLASGYLDQTGVSLGGLSNLAEYQLLFDQFKLSSFKITLRPNVLDLNQTQSASTLTYQPPYVHVIMDPASGVTPSGTYSVATVNSFLENGKVRTYRGDKKINIYVKRPKIIEEYGGGADRYVSPRWTQLDSQGINMPHRGFHLMHQAQNMTANNNVSYDVWITYYLRFKGMK